jgi:MerR family mercuric resistance operon transcriptional regulator
LKGCSGRIDLPGDTQHNQEAEKYFGDLKQAATPLAIEFGEQVFAGLRCLETMRRVRRKNVSGEFETSRILKLQRYQGMRIGELARTVDVNVETIRYYQRIRLLELPEKPYGGMRSYNDEDLQRLRFIRRAQHLGFSLEDIRELLELSSSDCERVEKLAVEKLSLVKAKLRQLRRIESILAEKDCTSANWRNWRVSGLIRFDFTNAAVYLFGLNARPRVIAFTTRPR